MTPRAKLFKDRSNYDLLGMPLMVFFISLAMVGAMEEHKVVITQVFVPSLVFIVVYMGLVFSVPDDRRAAHARRSRIVFFSFAAVVFGVAAAHYALDQRAITIWADMFIGFYYSALLSYLALFTVADMITSRLVNLKMVCSGFFGYLMLAMAYQHLYGSMHLAGMAVLSAPQPASGAFSLDVYLTNFYFSLTTISTLGYGDIVPVGRAARMAAASEAVAGQFYLAVLIGILVGKYLRGESGSAGGQA